MFCRGSLLTYSRPGTTAQVDVPSLVPAVVGALRTHRGTVNVVLPALEWLACASDNGDGVSAQAVERARGQDIVSYWQRVATTVDRGGDTPYSM
jgi:hypothetical protein